MRPLYDRVVDALKRTGYNHETEKAIAEVVVEAVLAPYPCCRHCKDDPVHDLPVNEHEVPCVLCEWSRSRKIIEQALTRIENAHSPYLEIKTIREQLEW